MHKYWFLSWFNSLYVSLSIQFLSLIVLGRFLDCLEYSHRVNVSPCWSTIRGMSISRCPQENIIHEFVLFFSCSAQHVLFVLQRWFFYMGIKWPYSCCFVRCCLQDVLWQLLVLISIFVYSLERYESIPSFPKLRLNRLCSLALI